MRKKITICFFLLIIGLFTSCSRENELDLKGVPENDVFTPKSGEEAAIKAFNDFLESFNTQATTRSKDKPSIVSIHKTNTLAYRNESIARSQNEGMPVYELTLQNTDSSEGFAIVLEDQTNHDILAYVPNGSIADTAFNVGLAIWFDELSTIQGQSLSRADVWQEGWDYETQIWISMPETHRYVSIEEAQNSTEWGNSYYGPIDNTRTFAAFVQTAWSQVNPYNNKVPQYYNNNGVTERCRVGCFAVALGQLMSYHKHPISYNWDLLISTPSISPYHTSAVNEVSRLLYDLALSGGTEYKLTGAGSTSVSKITPTLNSFGYNVTSTYLGTGQSSHISIEELKASRPVLFVAESTRGGHIWVIDGIFEFERWYYFPARIMPTESPSGIEIRRVRTMRRLSHCNWGWGGLSNGWYYNYTPKYTDGSYIKFNTQKWLYTGIVPK